MAETVFVHGGSVLCAQGGARLATGLAGLDFAAGRSVPRRLEVLGQSREVPYFAAFAEELLTAEALFDLLEAHIRAAADDAGLPQTALSRVPVFVGSGAYVLADRERRGMTGACAYSLDETAARLRRRFANPNVFALATSCTASAQAVVQAARAAAWGGTAVAAGVESFNRLTLAHFDALGLSEAGVVLGEAAAAVILSAETGGVAALRGITARTDPAALTAPCPHALTRLTDDCLRRAACPPNAIGAVKTHGGGNHAAETHAFAAFPRRLTFKPYIGHTLGAAGVAETVLLAGCLQRRRLPDGTPAPAAVLDYFPGFGGSHAAWVLHTTP